MRVIRAGGYDVHLHQSSTLGEALFEADFVILAISTGGLGAMRHDLEIPARYGIFHSVGDTVGPGGLSRGLRKIPVVVEIAREMEIHCPEAWLLNYTNPLSTLTRAVTRETSIKTIGLCHEWLGVREKLAQYFNAPEEALQPHIAGVNHLIWLLDLCWNGRSLNPKLQDMAEQVLAGDLDLDPGSTSPFADHGRVKARLLQVYGALPVAGDRHVAEFFPHFLSEAAGRGQAYAVALTSVADRDGWRQEDRARLEAILEGREDLRPYLQGPSSEAAHSIIAALVADGRYRGVMNLPNRGQITNLPRDVVVETIGVVEDGKANGICAGDLPPAIQAVVSRHVSNQELIVEAALTGSRTLARQALLNDPMVTIPPEAAIKMLDELLDANKAYLPLFFR
jgi:alpha-galactosidase